MTTPGSLAVALDPNAPYPYKQGREFVQRVVITTTGNYETGGLTLNLEGLNTPGASAPFEWHITPQAVSADRYDYIPGADRSAGKLIALAGTSEHTGDSAFADATIYATFRYRPFE